MNDTTIVDVCNQALDEIGQGRHIQALDNSSPESEACARLYPQTLNYCLNAANWSFARRDEVITEDYLLKDAVALPYSYCYKLPEDVMRILILTEYPGNSYTETRANTQSIQFNIRNYDNQRILATDHEPDFVIQYIAYINDLTVCDPTFIEGLAQILASKLSGALIKGATGVQIGEKLFARGFANLQLAAGYDAQQNATTINNGYESSFVRARR